MVLSPDACSVSRHAVVRSDYLPAAVGFNPYIGEAVVVFVGLAPGSSFFMIVAGDDDGVSVRVHVHISLLGHFHVHRTIGAVSDVTFFAIGAAILDGNYKILGEQGRQNVDVAIAISFGPFLRKPEGAVVLGCFLSPC